MHQASHCRCSCLPQVPGQVVDASISESVFNVMEACLTGVGRVWGRGSFSHGGLPHRCGEGVGKGELWSWRPAWR